MLLNTCGRFFRASNMSENQASTSSLKNKKKYETQITAIVFNLKFNSQIRHEVEKQQFSARRADCYSTGKQQHDFSLIVPAPKIVDDVKGWGGQETVAVAWISSTSLLNFIIARITATLSSFVVLLVVWTKHQVDKLCFLVLYLSTHIIWKTTTGWFVYIY